MQVIDCNVVWSSTTIFESDVLKVPSFVYEPIPNLLRHKTFGLEKYPTITNLNEITDDLIQFYQKEIASKKNYERYIGPVDNNSTKRVAEAILFILKNGVENYNAKEINNNKFLEFKQIAFQKVTRIMVKLNLLEYFKFPKSAYELRKDIPYSKNNK